MDNRLETDFDRPPITTADKFKKTRHNFKALFEGVDTARQGLTTTAQGLLTLAKGGLKTAEGTINLADEAVLGLGAFAIITLGTVTAPFRAKFDPERDMADIIRSTKDLANNPGLARLFGIATLGTISAVGYVNLSHQ